MTSVLPLRSPRGQDQGRGLTSIPRDVIGWEKLNNVTCRWARNIWTSAWDMHGYINIGYEMLQSHASPTGLHVVRTGFSSFGRGQTLHLSRAETTIPINTKFWTNDYVGQRKRLAKFRSDRFYGSGSPCGWSIQFQILVSFVTYFFCFCFFLCRQLTYRPQFATDFDVWWLKTRGLA